MEKVNDRDFKSRVMPIQCDRDFDAGDTVSHLSWQRNLYSFPLHLPEKQIRSSL
jgi:hypothetical protein